MIFSSFPYDYPILWSTTPTTAKNYNDLESHLRLLYLSPPLIQRMHQIVIFLGLAGLVSKLYKPSESNMLFDGASLVLYMCGITVYVANIVKGLRLAAGGRYGSELVADAAADAAAEVGAGTGAGAETDAADAGVVLGREDSLKVLAASNTILALVLVGILVLQAGQWYAERKNAQEEEEDVAAAGGGNAASVGKNETMTKENGGGGGNGRNKGGKKGEEEEVKSGDDEEEEEEEEEDADEDEGQGQGQAIAVEVPNGGSGSTGIDAGSSPRLTRSASRMKAT